MDSFTLSRMFGSMRPAKPLPTATEPVVAPALPYSSPPLGSHNTIAAAPVVSSVSMAAAAAAAVTPPIEAASADMDTKSDAPTSSDHLALEHEPLAHRLEMSLRGMGPPNDKSIAIERRDPIGIFNYMNACGFAYVTLENLEEVVSSNAETICDMDIYMDDNTPQTSLVAAAPLLHITPSVEVTWCATSDAVNQQHAFVFANMAHTICGVGRVKLDYKPIIQCMTSHNILFDNENISNERLLDTEASRWRMDMLERICEDKDVAPSDISPGTEQSQLHVSDTDSVDTSALSSRESSAALSAAATDISSSTMMTTTATRSTLKTAETKTGAAKTEARRGQLGYAPGLGVGSRGALITEDHMTLQHLLTLLDQLKGADSTGKLAYRCTQMLTGFYRLRCSGYVHLKLFHLRLIALAFSSIVDEIWIDFRSNTLCIDWHSMRLPNFGYYLPKIKADFSRLAQHKHAVCISRLPLSTSQQQQLQDRRTSHPTTMTATAIGAEPVAVATPAAASAAAAASAERTRASKTSTVRATSRNIGAVKQPNTAHVATQASSASVPVRSSAGIGKPMRASAQPTVQATPASELTDDSAYAMAPLPGLTVHAASSDRPVFVPTPARERDRMASSRSRSRSRSRSPGVHSSHERSQVLTIHRGDKKRKHRHHERRHSRSHRHRERDGERDEHRDRRDRHRSKKRSKSHGPDEVIDSSGGRSERRAQTPGLVTDLNEADATMLTADPRHSYQAYFADV